MRRDETGTERNGTKWARKEMSGPSSQPAIRMIWTNEMFTVDLHVVQFLRARPAHLLSMAAPTEPKINCAKINNVDGEQCRPKQWLRWLPRPHSLLTIRARVCVLSWLTIKAPPPPTTTTKAPVALMMELRQRNWIY